SQQRVGKSIARRPGTVRVEGEVAGVPGSPILVFTIPDEERAGLYRVLAVNYGQIVAHGDINCGRSQRSGWTTKIRIGGAAGESNVRDAIIVDPAREELRVRKTISLALPELAGWWNMLAIPSRVDLSFVN